MKAHANPELGLALQGTASAIGDTANSRDSLEQGPNVPALDVGPTGAQTPEQAAAARIRMCPDQREAILRSLHRSRGNSFVQRVIAELSRPPGAGTAEGSQTLLAEEAHAAQRQEVGRDPRPHLQPAGREAPAAWPNASHVTSNGLATSANAPASPSGATQTALRLQPQQGPNPEAQSLEQKAALIRKAAVDGESGWGRVVVDTFEQMDPAARIALQHQLDMAMLVGQMPDFEATRLGTLGPLTTGQAILNKKRAAYIKQVIDDFGERAEVFVLFALRGVYDDDAYTIFGDLANQRYLHKLLAMPEVTQQIKARGLKTDSFNEP